MASTKFARIVILLLVILGCSTKKKVDPSLLKLINSPDLVYDTLALKTNDQVFIDAAKVRMNSTYIGLLNPLSASFSLYDQEGNKLNYFNTNKVEKRGSSSYIIGGQPVDFMFYNDTSVSFFENSNSKITTYTLSGKEIDRTEFSDDGQNVSIPIQSLLNTFSFDTKQYFFSKNGISINSGRDSIRYKDATGILYSLDKGTGSLKKLMTINDVIKHLTEEKLTFFQIGVFEGYQYLIFNNDPTIYIFDGKNKFENAINLNIPEISFIKSLTLRQQSQGFGISNFSISEAGFRLFLNVPEKQGMGPRALVIDIDQSFTEYKLFEGPINFKYVISDYSTDLAFYGMTDDDVMEVLIGRIE
ncbi:hypothetical protein [Roseivirga sp. UBA1976]|uniref:hypothetical protein n=1 Tax=Roseivirga sp. UBA1976 TaxID=1947386 RepID=UPI0025809D00|nr:hypothetical protein [Roseivirga sp. UBA1976]|tara:strand:+ start:4372 stop:5445 length:1074 start_codon:yes stop_codon:yes gene_type:complete